MDRATLFFYESWCLSLKKEQEMHFPSKLGTRLALCGGGGICRGSAPAKPVFLRAFKWKDAPSRPVLLKVFKWNQVRTWPACSSQGPLIENQVLTWPGKEWRMSWAGLAACCFRESITSPFVLRSYQVSILTVIMGVLFCWRYIWTDRVSRYWKPDQLHLAHLLLPDLVVRVRDEVLPHLHHHNDGNIVAIMVRMMRTVTICDNGGIAHDVFHSTSVRA